MSDQQFRQSEHNQDGRQDETHWPAPAGLPPVPNDLYTSTQGVSVPNQRTSQVQTTPNYTRRMQAVGRAHVQGLNMRQSREIIVSQQPEVIDRPPTRRHSPQPVTRPILQHPGPQFATTLQIEFDPTEFQISISGLPPGSSITCTWDTPETSHSVHRPQPTAPPMALFRPTIPQQHRNRSQASARFAGLMIDMNDELPGQGRLNREGAQHIQGIHRSLTQGQTPSLPPRLPAKNSFIDNLRPLTERFSCIVCGEAYTDTHQPVQLPNTNYTAGSSCIKNPNQLKPFLSDHNCSICGDTFKDDHPPVQLPDCKHVYGSPCIYEALETNTKNANKCPLCRRELFVSEYESEVEEYSDSEEEDDEDGEMADDEEEQPELERRHQEMDDAEAGTPYLGGQNERVRAVDASLRELVRSGFDLAEVFQEFAVQRQSSSAAATADGSELGSHGMGEDGFSDHDLDTPGVFLDDLEDAESSELPSSLYSLSDEYSDSSESAMSLDGTDSEDEDEDDNENEDIAMSEDLEGVFEVHDGDGSPIEGSLSNPIYVSSSDEDDDPDGALLDDDDTGTYHVKGRRWDPNEHYRGQRRIPKKAKSVAGTGNS